MSLDKIGVGTCPAEPCLGAWCDHDQVTECIFYRRPFAVPNQSSLSLWRRAIVRAFLSNRPKFEWRWYLYAPLLLMAAGWFVVGFSVRNPQQVVYTGEMVQGSEASDGTKLKIESKVLAEGTLTTVADKISALTSLGRPLVVHINGGPSACSDLENSGTWEPDSITFSCGPESGIDLIRASGISLGLEFSEPTPLTVESLAGDNLNIQGMGLFGEFFASLRITVSNTRILSPAGQIGRCESAFGESETKPALVVTARNQPGVKVTLDAPGSRKSITPWRSGVPATKPLCIVIETSKQGSKSRLTTRYRQTFVPVSGNYVADYVEIERSSGLLTVASEPNTILRRDAIRIESEEPGRVSLSDQRIDLEMPKAISVRKDLEKAGAGGRARRSRGEDLRRRWLETWPPWLQASIGVLLSGLGLQVMIPLIVPTRLKR